MCLNNNKKKQKEKTKRKKKKKKKKKKTKKKKKKKRKREEKESFCMGWELGHRFKSSLTNQLQRQPLPFCALGRVSINAHSSAARLPNTRPTGATRPQEPWVPTYWPRGGQEGCRDTTTSSSASRVVRSTQTVNPGWRHDLLKSNTAHAVFKEIA